MIPHLASTHCHRCRRRNTAVRHLVYIPNIRHFLIGRSREKKKRKSCFPVRQKEGVSILLWAVQVVDFLLCSSSNFACDLFLLRSYEFLLLGWQYHSSCLPCVALRLLLPTVQRKGLYLHRLRWMKKSRVDEGIVVGKATSRSSLTTRFMLEYRRGAHDWKPGMSFEVSVSEWQWEMVRNATLMDK
ncbi:hypothetical protein F4820DRAFT_414181 [Hypoxylon rubiginosum]|uniref:Uncharacterized protein n=1 Tax=Hypoxylon rubiginosum TaxID=110542 RepID=A0ACB9Z791_9PEZI|nr:hypothetical protein F4820DRAFT_414181 [Hypoxylon rubiginosum]